MSPFVQNWWVHEAFGRFQRVRNYVFSLRQKSSPSVPLFNSFFLVEYVSSEIPRPRQIISYSNKWLPVAKVDVRPHFLFMTRRFLSRAAEPESASLACLRSSDTTQRARIPGSCIHPHVRSLARSLARSLTHSEISPLNHVCTLQIHAL